MYSRGGLSCLFPGAGAVIPPAPVDYALLGVRCVDENLACQFLMSLFLGPLSSSNDDICIALALSNQPGGSVSHIRDYSSRKQRRDWITKLALGHPV
jgi:hypothetical protein